MTAIASSGTAMETMRMQLQSARKSILFLETQHAETLKALHAEIKALQTNCSRMSFQLAMIESDQHNSYNINVLDNANSINTKEDQSLESENFINEKVKLLQEIEERDKQIVALEEDNKMLEIKYLKTIQIQNHKITTLLGESDSKASTIVFLQSELSKARRKLHLKSNEKINSAESRGEITPITNKSELYKSIQPTPPPYPSNRTPLSSQSSRSSRRYSSQSSLVDSIDDSQSTDSERPTSSHRFRRSRGSEEQLNPVKGDVKLQPRPPTVLPPIKSKNMVTDGLLVSTKRRLSATTPQSEKLHGIHKISTKDGNIEQLPTKHYVRVQPNTSELVVRNVASRMSPERKLQEG